VSSGELRDVYLGLWLDTTVGNTEYKTPYDSQATNRWDYWDDYNGAWGPVGVVEPTATVEDDPNIWMAYEHDADGDEGLATSWIGYRLLGTNLAPATGDTVPPVSFNMWRFRGVPERDDQYENPDEPGVMLPGKYQIMKNHNFDVGDKPGEQLRRPVELGQHDVDGAVHDLGARRHADHHLRHRGGARFAGPALEQQGGAGGLRRRLHHPVGPAVAAHRPSRPTTIR
jgi:hypothetical protein